MNIEAKAMFITQPHPQMLQEHLAPVQVLSTSSWKLKSGSTQERCGLSADDP